MEAYKAPSYYAGDPYSKKLDLDAFLRYQIVNWDNKKSGENRRSVVITGDVSSTGIFGWLNKGYPFSPILLELTANIDLGWGHINGSYQHIFKSKHVNDGPVELIQPGLQTVTAQWNGISVDMSGGPYQTTKEVSLTAEKIYADPNSKPQITINAGNVDYQIRALGRGRMRSVKML